MGGTMLEGRTNEELAGTLSLGLVTEGAVRALGRVIRDESLTADDNRVLRAARHLFERMAEDEVVVVRALTDQMVTDESYLDALHVVELEAGGELQKRARRYVELLQGAVDGQLSDRERQELVGLRDLMINVGETTLARANELSRAYPEATWRPPLQAISRF